VTKRYDTLIELFEELNRYLDCLVVRLQAVPHSPHLVTASRKLAVETLITLLDVVALSVEIIKRKKNNRLGMWFHFRLLYRPNSHARRFPVHYAQSLGLIRGHEDMQKALDRLKLLCIADIRATVTETQVAVTQMRAAVDEAHATAEKALQTAEEKRENGAHFLQYMGGCI
jgi:hypothetical protein